LAILPELETARLSLRRLTIDDAPFVAALYNEPSFIENIGDRGVRNVDDAQRNLKRFGKLGAHCSWSRGP